jgi:flagellar FliL protein
VSQDAEQQPKKKLPIVKIALFAVGGLLLLGAGVGGGILFVKMTKPVEENPLAIIIERKAEQQAAEGEKKAEAGKEGAAPAKDAHGNPIPGTGGTGKPVPATEKFVTNYFEFPGNFTTNLRGSKRFVQMSLALSTQYDKTVIENVQKHEVAIRAEVLAILAEQSEADMVGMDNRKRIQGLLAEAINRVLQERVEFGGISNVFITALVMQ